MLRNIKLSSICDIMHLKFIGNDANINGLNLCDRKSAYDNILSYATSSKYAKFIRENKSVTCMVVSGDLVSEYGKAQIGRDISFIVSDSPEKTFYEIHEYLYHETDFYDKYDFPPKIGADCEIDGTAIIERGTIIGARVKIGPLSVIRRGSVIGDDVTVGCHAIIGSEGFQVLRIDGKNYKAPHVGGLSIGNGSSIGSHTVVCNSLFEDTTRIGENVMIDNFVQIAHNIVIEDSAVITAGAMLAGSCHIGRNAWIAPNATIMNRVIVGEGAKVGIGSVVLRNVKPNITIFGNPAGHWRNELARESRKGQ